MSKGSQGDNFDSGGGNMNVAKDGGTATQHNYYGNAAPPGASTPPSPAASAFEEIEHLLAQNKVLKAIERLRSLPEHRREAINFSRRWHAIRDKQRKGLLTGEQAETEVNKIVDAMLEICAGSQTAGGSSQSAEGSSQSAEGSMQPAAPSVHQSGRDYFENVGGNVYNAPVTIVQQAAEAAAPPIMTAPTHLLRSEALEVSVNNDKEEFQLNQRWQPRHYIQNAFEVHTEMVLDRATGLMWQRSGSDDLLYHQEALKSIEVLRQACFAGYTDWRLPTIPELMSLIETEQLSEGLHIARVFDKHQKACWSIDTVKESADKAWNVDFELQAVFWHGLVAYARGVRSEKMTV